MLTQDQLLALLDDPDDDTLIRLHDAGSRVLDPSMGWSSDGTRSLLQELRRIISEGSPRG